MDAIVIDQESFEPVARSLYKQLREAILLGRIAPGARINEREFSESVNVSRTPLREALRLLEREGLVRHVPRRGVEVVGLSKSDIDGIYAMRVLLEGLAASWAAERITEADLKLLERNIQETAASIDDFTTDKYIRCQDEFNNLISRAAGHKHLTTVLDSLRDYLRAFRIGTFSEPGRRREAYEEHKAIYEAIKRREAQEACEAAEHHSNNSWSTFKRYLHEEVELERTA